MNGYKVLMNTINRVQNGEDPNQAAESEISKITEDAWLEELMNELPPDLIFADLDAA